MCDGVSPQAPPQSCRRPCASAECRRLIEGCSGYPTSLKAFWFCLRTDHTLVTLFTCCVKVSTHSPGTADSLDGTAAHRQRLNVRLQGRQNDCGRDAGRKASICSPPTMSSIAQACCKSCGSSSSSPTMSSVAQGCKSWGKDSEHVPSWHARPAPTSWRDIPGDANRAARGRPAVAYNRRLEIGILAGNTSSTLSPQVKASASQMGGHQLVIDQGCIEQGAFDKVEAVKAQTHSSLTASHINDVACACYQRTTSLI